jgi:DNA invertase Pin-like site-specific DNA recombinase
MPRKLVAYIRVSTRRQGDSGLGLEAQTSAVEGYAKAIGASIVETYREVESGKRADRPELHRAIAHAKRFKATLVIAKLDRLARNVHFISGLMEAGVDFVACDKPGKDRFMLHIEAAFAEEEARRIGERTKAALAAYKARGGKLGTDNLTSEGRAEGSRRSGERARTDADAAYADLTLTVKGLRAEGLTLRAIAERLDAAGETTRRGKPWNPVQVARVLERAGR